MNSRHSSNGETAAPSPAETYIDNVISGAQVACKWVRLACERHRRDLVDGHERGLWFDSEAGQHIIDFASFCRHSKGEWAGQVVTLEPWQQALLWILFGWRRADGTRRFRTSYWEVARKNGKSTLAAIVGLYMLIGDGEGGAEIYAAATKRAQAKLVFDESTRMVKSSPALKKRLVCFRDNIHIKNTASKFEPLGRDADSMDGLNPHCAIVDEVHAHRSDEVWGVLETGMGSRRQSLMFGITTAGFNQASFCYQLRDYATKVLDGIVDDDSFFAVIYTLDKGDDWRNEDVWIKANPNLGVSVKLSEMRDLVVKAGAMLSALGHFLTKRLNIWTNAGEQWMSAERWTACAFEVDEAALAGRVCYAGLDLSYALDLTTFVLVFPPTEDDPLYRILPRFWVPETAMITRSRAQRVPYDEWGQQGYITIIPGEVIDYEYIYAQIDQDAQTFDIKEIAYDRYGAAEIYVRMAKVGMSMVQFGQGFISMSPPMKELEKLVISQKIAHGGNPVLAWNAHNLVAATDSAGNIKPDKKKSTEKIDGMVAAIMALDRATRHDDTVGHSVYERRDVREL
jgi:phage terminase large subunit-like protein